jgi:ABC-type lipoprotein release transport system permease subunit
VAFGILLMAVLGLLAGLLPAIQAMRLQVATALRRA